MPNSRPVAIITGAASGIGRSTAERLAEAGYDLTLVSRTTVKLHETADLARRAGAAAQCLILSIDITSPAAAGQIVARTVDCFGRLDALVHVAGYASLTPIEQATPDAWRATIDTNLSAAVMLTAAAWAALRESRGTIVNVSSMASVDPFPRFAMYAAAKAGLNMFTQCTAREGAEVGIRAVAVAPGAVETPMLRSMFDEQAIPRDKTLPPAAVAAVIRDCVTGRRAFEPGETILVPSP